MALRDAHFALIMVFLMIWPASGCFAQERAQGRPVYDQAGRRIPAPENPQRIIALAPSITEMIYTLGEQHRLVGVAQHSDFPAEAESLTSIGSFIHPDIEKIVSLRPDLCLALKEGNPRDVVARLGSEGVVVYVLSTPDLDGIARSLLEIGELLDVRQKAQTAAEGMRSKIDRIKSLTARAMQRPKVFFQLSDNPLVSVGSGTFADELITDAGGSNVSKNYGTYPRLTKEQVLVFSPDVIIITSMTKGEELKLATSNWDQWASIPAVSRGRVYVVDSDLFDRPSVRLADALETLARLIHPELF